MTNLFDGIDDIDWASLETSRNSSAKAFPEYLRNMLTDNQEQYEKAFESIQDMLQHSEDTWSEAAPYIIRYLLRFFDSDEFQFKGDLLERLSGWFEALDRHFDFENKYEFQKDYNQLEKEIYYIVIEYFDRFIPYLKYETLNVRYAAVTIIYNFREKETEWFPILLEHLETETDQLVFGLVLDTLISSIAYQMEYTEVQVEKIVINKIIDLYLRINLADENIERKCRSAIFLATTLPHLIPDEVIHILEDVYQNHPTVFKQNKYSIGSAIQALRPHGYTFNIPVWMR